MNTEIPRILFSAGSSGSGKTLITCGILQVIGTKSRNLDTFFTGEEVTRYLLAKNSADCEIAVMEGVMGFYDGVAGTTTQASAYDLARVTKTPVILIVNSRGMSVSLAAYIKGFLEYKKDSNIKGVIFNQMSPMLYPRMKTLVEEELGIHVFGYVPKVEDCVIESRHLGLVMPEEIPQLKERLQKLSQVLEKTLEIDEILKLAKSASVLSGSFSSEWKAKEKLRIGLAKDEAFCFFYEDNLALLKEMGAELIPFSPIHDKHLPENLDGLLLYGGYPELNGQKLEANITMRGEIRQALTDGMPCLAECGGFMYLHEQMEGMDGRFYQMAGAISGKVFRTPGLTRFGYITLNQNREANVLGMRDFDRIPSHEFHYFDSDNCGNAFYAKKPLSTRGWECIHGTERLLAGFPHLYYYGNPQVPEAFLSKCEEYRKETRKMKK